MGFINLVRYCSTYALKRNTSYKEINKILIANRGEIACRIIKTARRLGVRTVAIFSEADEKSCHTNLADEAYFIGPAPSRSSYLCQNKIIEVAKKSNCQAIHPGYGFLSENVEFAELCANESIIFIGPPASAIRDMGIKNTSKEIMSNAGVPVINGYHGKDQSDEKLIEEAIKIGFPLMIKAVRGGGGKGMRVANSLDDFSSSLESARNESLKSFGDNSVLLERFVRSPRHVEVQVFADSHGNAVYLYERDCSVQRRHQKIIEEAPAPGISEKLRRNLGEAAVRAAKAVGYIGAGTVEFILDKDDLSFHFMEMNTRLQVEHPITEMITGIDLVEWQIKIASGEAIPATQEEIFKNGHSFEARIYAENPRENFLPGAGILEHLTTPNPTSVVRIETGVEAGDEVSVHYDPMIAKLVVWGQNRNQALDSLIKCLTEYHITGLETNINFLISLGRNKHFRLGDVHTNFIDQHKDELFPEQEPSERLLCEASIALITNEFNAAVLNTNIHNSRHIHLIWNAANLRINSDLMREFQLKFNDRVYKTKVMTTDNGLKVQVENGGWKFAQTTTIPDKERFVLNCTIDGRKSTLSSVIDSKGLTIFNENGKSYFEFIHPKFCNEISSDSKTAGLNILSPMPGVLEKLFVKPGDRVKKGDSVAVIIAMKMEYVLKANREAVVKNVFGNPGENIPKGKVIITFEI